MISTCKKHLSFKQLSLVHDKPVIFIISQWQRELKPSVFYLIYRWIIALFFSITFILSIVDPNNPGQPSSVRAKWLIYLTNWGFTICTLQSLFVAVLLSICTAALYFRSVPNLQERALRYYKIYWTLNTIATDVAFGITALYWSVIYDETQELNAMNVLVHGCNSIFMMIDLFAVSHPIRLLHCCYTITFGLCYAIFSGVYYAAGGTARDGHTYIYPILDWGKPGRTLLICVGVVCFLIVIHILTYGLHRLRIFLSHTYLRKKNGADDESEPTKMSYINEGMATNDII